MMPRARTVQHQLSLLDLLAANQPTNKKVTYTYIICEVDNARDTHWPFLFV